MSRQTKTEQVRDMSMRSSSPVCHFKGVSPLCGHRSPIPPPLLHDAISPPLLRRSLSQYSIAQQPFSTVPFAMGNQNAMASLGITQEEFEHTYLEVGKQAKKRSPLAQRRRDRGALYQDECETE